ncbi:SCO family protein [Thiobacter aerophilum]|uniref:SCO family protein n=1 Tax=Thiobacter aerophilum TaxID=3121275 RepID=A0ABV0EE95_9BURK
MSGLFRFLPLLLAFLLVGCGQQPPAFQGTDITGADWGRDFRLTDHTGKVRTLADFRGKVVVMFFGYTHCPDVCPTTLGEMAQVMKRLGPDAQRVQVLFVTLDPARDTPTLLAQYVPAFYPTFLGLYGDEATTRKIAADFKVFYQKQAGSDPDQYTLDHGANTYVFDPQGRLRLLFGFGAGAEPMVHDIKLLLAGA